MKLEGKRFKGHTSYPHENRSATLKKGVLLVNLGTPDAPNTASLRRYLREFLSDPRVVEIPRLLWLIILYCFILPFRPKKSAKLYQSIWTEQGSPLLVISKQQQVALQEKLDTQADASSMVVELGMRYAQPSIKSALDKLSAQNIRDITVIPLYPQYSGATTGSTFDSIAKALSQYRWVPSMRFINGYHTHPLYIKAIAQSITDYIEHTGLPDKFIFSYHGVPQRYLEQGDPYYCFCLQTTRLVREHLSLNEMLVTTTFQSRFGKAQWLQPYTDVTLKNLAQQGHHKVAVICPGFAADCLETLEEIMHENRAYFLAAGGKHYDYIPCLNADDEHITLLQALVQQELS